MRPPRLHFRLPGTWHHLDLQGGDQSEASIETVVRNAIGVADDRAILRADLRRDLRTAVESARQAEATCMMFSTEIAPGSPLPVTLVVYAPSRLRMSPSIGTSPERVLAVLAESMRQQDPERAASIAHRTDAGGPVVRTHRVEPIEPTEETGGALRLTADYWIPMPDTKRVVMVRLSTPMGEIENILLSLYDVVVEAAYFDAGRTDAVPPRG